MYLYPEVGMSGCIQSCSDIKVIKLYRQLLYKYHELVVVCNVRMCSSSVSRNANGNKQVIFFPGQLGIVIILSYEPLISLHVQYA